MKRILIEDSQQKDLLIFLLRTELKGNEAHALVNLIETIRNAEVISEPTE